MYVIHHGEDIFGKLCLMTNGGGLHADDGYNPRTPAHLFQVIMHVVAVSRMKDVEAPGVAIEERDVEGPIFGRDWGRPVEKDQIGVFDVNGHQ